MSRDNLPFYESFLQRHFPSWHARRESARAESAMSSYRRSVATRVGRQFGRSRSVKAGTRAERWQLGKMRDRGRQLYRENPIARSLADKESQYVVGNGFTLQLKSDSVDWNKEVEARWYKWLETADVRGMFTGEELQKLGWTQTRVDGDGGFILRGKGYTSQLQYIPGDLISTPRERIGDQNIFDGVEVDDAMKPIAFHIEDIDQDGKRTWSRIAADDFVYVAHLNNPLDARGCTAYLTIFDILEQLEGYIDAVAIAARMAAIFGLIFKEENPGKQVGALPGRATGSDGKEYRAITLEGGMVKYVGKEGDVAQVQASQPMQQTPDFIRALFRLAGLPFDMPLEIAAQDLSQVNFSGARVGLMGFYRACIGKETKYKAHWSRIFRWWLSRERKFAAAGVVEPFKATEPANWWEHELHGQERELNDRLAEAQADFLEIEMGVKSPQQVTARRAGDWQDVQKEKAEALKLLENLGLPTNIRSNNTRDALAPTPATSLTINTGHSDSKQDKTDSSGGSSDSGNNAGGSSNG